MVPLLFGPTRGPPKFGKMGLGRTARMGPTTFTQMALGRTAQVQILVPTYPYHAPFLLCTSVSSCGQRGTTLMGQETLHSQPDTMIWQRHTRSQHILPGNQGIFLLLGPRGALFLMIGVPLHFVHKEPLLPYARPCSCPYPVSARRARCRKGS